MAKIRMFVYDSLREIKVEYLSSNKEEWVKLISELEKVVKKLNKESNKLAELAQNYIDEKDQEVIGDIEDESKNS